MVTGGGEGSTIGSGSEFLGFGSGLGTWERAAVGGMSAGGETAADTAEEAGSLEAEGACWTMSGAGGTPGEPAGERPGLQVEGAYW